MKGKTVRRERKQIVSRFAALCSMCILVLLFTFAVSTEVRAKDWTSDKSKKTGQCTLKSVTFELDGKDYVCDGKLKCIGVDRDVDWKSLFSANRIRIKDYEVLVNDKCSHEKGHGSIEAKIRYSKDMGEDLKSDYFTFLSYDGESKINQYKTVEEIVTGQEQFFDVWFCLDGDKQASLVAGFCKEYSISYELNGGQFPEGTELKENFLVGDSQDYFPPHPEKGDLQFLGWRKKGDSPDSKPVYKFCLPNYTGDISLEAIWGTEPRMEISEYAEVKFDRVAEGKECIKEWEASSVGLRPESTVYWKGTTNYMQYGQDYFCRYENNTKVTPTDATDADMAKLIIIGAGKYKGTLEKTFRIKAMDIDECMVLTKIENLCGEKGKALSTVAIKEDSLELYRSSDKKTISIKGSFRWKEPEGVLTAEVGTSEQCQLIFTPDYPDGYSKKEIALTTEVNVKKSIRDCSVSFAPDQNYTYTGEDICPKVIVKDGETELAEIEDYRLEYTGNISSGRGEEECGPRVKIIGVGEYFESKEMGFTIFNAPQTAPSLTAANETIRGKEDGIIKGLTTDMEYRKVRSQAEEEEKFTPVSDQAMSFPAGKYEVRYKEKENYDPSPVSSVTIQQGRALTLTLPSVQTGYKLTASSYDLSWKESVTLTLRLAPGYSKTEKFDLQSNQKIQDNQDGTYTISDINDDVCVLLTGIEDVTAPQGSIRVNRNVSDQFCNKVSYEEFSKNSIEVVIDAEDSHTGSGIDLIQYYVSDKELTMEEIENLSADSWTNYTASFLLQDTGSWIVYAKIADNAGNTRILNSCGVVIYQDAAQETEQVNYTKESQTDVSAKVKLNGNTIQAVWLATEEGSISTSPLLQGKDYSLNASGEEICLSAAYLETLSVGKHKFLVSYHPQGREYVEKQDENGVDLNDVPANTSFILNVGSAPTPEPTATPEPTPEPTVTPEPTPEPTATPEPTPEPTVTPEPTPEPTATIEPTPEATATPAPTLVVPATIEPTAVATATVVPTPVLPATIEPTPEATATLLPTTAPPTTQAPTTPAPTTQAPVTQVPATPVPTPVVSPTIETTAMALPTFPIRPILPTLTPVPTVAPTGSNVWKKGKELSDSKTKASYTIVNVGKAGAGVNYTRPLNKKTKNINIPNTVTIGGIKYKVVSLAPNAFANNKKISKVTIGKNITTIGKKAFYACKNLKNIKILTTKLTSSQIKKDAFKGISPKATITVPKSKYKKYKTWLPQKGVSKRVKIKKN